MMSGWIAADSLDQDAGSSDAGRGKMQKSFEPVAVA